MDAIPQKLDVRSLPDKKPHLAAYTEGFEWVKTEPTIVSGFSEAIHKLCIQSPLNG